MQAHVADLLDQHRRSDDLDDAAFCRVLLLFYEAQLACTQGRFGEGLAVYTQRWLCLSEQRLALR